MSDKELEEYINKIEPNFDIHLEKGTIEMSNEYYNLLEEKMVRLINKNQELKKENKILRENAEHNDKVVDKTNWENLKLKKELEEYKLITIDYQELEARNQKLNNQQKEFINYMNKTIEELECDDVGDEELKGYLIQEIDIFKEILSKYNEIIEK